MKSCTHCSFSDYQVILSDPLFHIVLLWIPVLVCKFLSFWVQQIPKKYSSSVNQLCSPTLMSLLVSNHSSEFIGRDLIPWCLQISLTPLLQPESCSWTQLHSGEQRDSLSSRHRHATQFTASVFLLIFFLISNCLKPNVEFNLLTLAETRSVFAYLDLQVSPEVKDDSRSPT